MTLAADKTFFHARLQFVQLNSLTAVLLIVSPFLPPLPSPALASERNADTAASGARSQEYRSTLSHVYLRHGDHPQAVTHLQEAAGLAPRPGTSGEENST